MGEPGVHDPARVGSDARDRRYLIEAVPAARPIFCGRGDMAMAPPDGFEPPTPALGRLRSIH